MEDPYKERKDRDNDAAQTSGNGVQTAEPGSERVPGEKTGEKCATDTGEKPERTAEAVPTASVGDDSAEKGFPEGQLSEMACDAPTHPSQGPGKRPATLPERLRLRKRSIMRRIEYQRLRRIRKRSVPAYVHCKNCGEVLRGMYCHRCGQYALDIEQPFWKYIKQYFENVYQFDGKVWQTLYLLFRRPGLLTKEFNAGKINSYVHPLRLYMFVSVLFFTLFFMFASTSIDRQIEQTQILNLPREVADSLKRGVLRPDTTVWVREGRQFVELLFEKGIAGCDTLFETVPVHRTTGLALMHLPRMVVDSCFYETPLTESDSLKIEVLKKKYTGEVFKGTTARGSGNHGPKPLDKRSAFFTFQPGTTPVYDWRNQNREMAMQGRTFINMLMAALSKWTPFFMMFLLPLFALLIRFAYRRSRIRYMNHFVHAIHINTAFLLLVAAPTSLLLFSLTGLGYDTFTGYEPAFRLVPTLLLVLIFGYMAVSFRTVYGAGWIKTVLKTLFVFCTFSLVALLLAAGLILWIILYYSERL